MLSFCGNIDNIMLVGRPLLFKSNTNAKPGRGMGGGVVVVDSGGREMDDTDICELAFSSAKDLYSDSLFKIHCPLRLIEIDNFTTRNRNPQKPY